MIIQQGRLQLSRSNLNYVRFKNTNYLSIYINKRARGKRSLFKSKTQVQKTKTFSVFNIIQQSQSASNAKDMMKTSKNYLNKFKLSKLNCRGMPDPKLLLMKDSRLDTCTITWQRLAMRDTCSQVKQRSINAKTVLKRV